MWWTQGLYDIIKPAVNSHCSMDWKLKLDGLMPDVYALTAPPPLSHSHDLPTARAAHSAHCTTFQFAAATQWPRKSQIVFVLSLLHIHSQLHSLLKYKNRKPPTNRATTETRGGIHSRSSGNSSWQNICNLSLNKRRDIDTHCTAWCTPLHISPPTSTLLIYCIGNCCTVQYIERDARCTRRVTDIEAFKRPPCCTTLCMRFPPRLIFKEKKEKKKICSTIRQQQQMIDPRHWMPSNEPTLLT